MDIGNVLSNGPYDLDYERDFAAVSTVVIKYPLLKLYHKKTYFPFIIQLKLLICALSEIIRPLTLIAKSILPLSDHFQYKLHIIERKIFFIDSS